MTRPALLRLAQEIASRGEAFVLATVVRREPPSSAQVGDNALVTRTGELHGWLGGSCTHPTVVREALAALETGKPCLLALSPTPEAETRAGVRALAMTCHSGGSVDIYIEPIRPAPQLVVFGVAPATRALARLGAVLGWSVLAVDPEADASTFPEAERVLAAPPRLEPGGAPVYAVVATLGERDEAALREALSLEPAYIGMIASRTRFSRMHALLREQGVSEDDLARVRTPAGLDIGAVTPEEIALSIVAEIVQRARAGTLAAPAAVAAQQPAREAIDPVCGMTVRNARHTAEYEGTTYSFCCGGCRSRFVATPQTFLAGTGGSQP